ncbi:unnamed protein product [Protopolystoma xenopodis]|uniref:Uncharacterized protein n=1 Tax=Protopolystoma xenopodis TaxID=117903 RepID=A0A3S5C811_9PLAT|nr:unnamed protein product [Protopolystoma xenopodis]
MLALPLSSPLVTLTRGKRKMSRLNRARNHQLIDFSRSDKIQTCNVYILDRPFDLSSLGNYPTYRRYRKRIEACIDPASWDLARSQVRKSREGKR